MELYRKSNIFERLLTLYSSVLCTSAHRRQILELIYRAINLGSGMTLITRMGIESWFAIKQADDMDRELIMAIEDQMHDRIDRTAAQQWRIPSATTLEAL
jgi:nucleolar pre-ribosomal-associated protein 1